MVVCSKCNTSFEDGAAFCPNCGAPVNGAAPNQYPGVQYVYIDPNDHTAEFNAQDISDNKVWAMLCYIAGIFGIILASLVAGNSPYVKFHMRQAAKILVLCLLLSIVAVALFWTILVPFAAIICALILLIVDIICFFNVCAGKAKEAPIVSTFKFLK